MPAALCLPILFFALGLSSKDGVMTLIGFLLVFAAGFLIFSTATISYDNNDGFVISEPKFTN
jgi:hypothetical protein